MNIKNIMDGFMNNFMEMQNININDKEDIFSGHISIEDFYAQVIFEIYKDNLYDLSEKENLKELVTMDCKGEENPLSDNFDSRYQKCKRTLKYTQYYKDITKEKYKNVLIEEQIQYLTSSNMNSIKERIKGYKIDQYRFSQLKNIDEIEILKKIIGKQIISTKKISNKEFIDLYKDLDAYYIDLKEKFENEGNFEWIINLYEIEKNYATELIYGICEFLEDKNLEIKEIRFYIGYLLFISLQCDIKISIENRFINKKLNYIPDIVNCNQTELNRLINILICKFNFINMFGSQIQKEIDNKNKILYLQENYNLFLTYPKEKNWTNKKIKIARELFNLIFDNIKSPKIY